MYSLIRSLLFKLSAETSHEVTLDLLGAASRLGISRLMPEPETYLPTEFCGLTFSNPVGLAAGLDKNGDYIQALSRLGFGFVEVGTVTPRPQSGNAKPRLFRLPADEAIINRMGFNNLGVDNLVKNIKKTKYQGILGINIGKNKDTSLEDGLADYLLCMDKVYELASYITINISSPNTPGLRELQTDSYLDNFLQGLKTKQLELHRATAKYTPLVLKVAPDIDTKEIEQISASIVKHKIDAIMTTNTSIDKSLLSNKRIAQQQGGVSGRIIFESSLGVQQQFNRILKGKIPIIAVGGIDSGVAAQGRLGEGASLVQVYTGLIYKGPKLVNEILNVLKNKGTGVAG